MRRCQALVVATALLSVAGCRLHHVVTVTDPVVVVVRIRIQQELEDYFAEIDALNTASTEKGADTR